MLHHMPTTDTAVAAAVRAELARAGISGRRLSRDLGGGWTAGKTQRRLAGKEPLRVGELAQIAEYLDIPVQRFFVAPETTPAHLPRRPSTTARTA